MPSRELDHRFMRGMAVAAIIGSVALIGSNVWGSLVVPDYNWISDTVSDLAAGRYEYIQDIGLYLYAIGVLAMALGLAHVGGRDTRWSVGVAALGLTAILITVIGARNEYGDRDNEGVVVHVYIVYAMGLTFATAFFALAKGLTEMRSGYGAISIILGVMWCLGAVIFFVMPTSFDGIWERGLGVVTILWLCLAARALFVHGD